jgi:uncharacterized protein DUF6152
VRALSPARLCWAIMWATVALVLTPVPVRAHHSFFAEFDIHQPFTVTGTVTRIEWTNPHIQFTVDVSARNGKVTTWTFSGDAARVLSRRGIDSQSLKLGDVVKIDGYRALDGSFRGAAGAVTLPNRKRIFVGPLEEPTPI